MRVFLCALVFLAFAGTGYAQQAPPPARSLPLLAVYILPPPQTSARQTTITPTYVVYAQGNPLWGKSRLGLRTISGQGCLASVYAMAATQAGRPMNPGQLVTAFRRKGLIAKGGLLSYQIHRAVPLMIERRITVSRTRDRGLHDPIRSYLASGKFVALKLDRDPGPSFREHWVLVTHVLPNDLAIIDPAGGKETTLKNRYRTARIVEVRVLRPLPLA